MGCSALLGRKGFLPYIVAILSIVFLYSCNKNIPGTTSKKDSGKSEMMAKSGDEKTMESKSSSEMKKDAPKSKI